MKGRFTERACKKAIVAFFAALCILPLSGGNGLAAEEPPAKAPLSSADELTAISKEIQQLVKGIGYTDDTDIDLLQILSRWDYTGWKQMLSQVKQDYQQKKISAEQAAQEEEKVLNALCITIKKEFSPAAGDSEY
jgi:hypothetical protein